MELETQRRKIKEERANTEDEKKRASLRPGGPRYTISIGQNAECGACGRIVGPKAAACLAVGQATNFRGAYGPGKKNRFAP